MSSRSTSRTRASSSRISGLALPEQARLWDGDLFSNFGEFDPCARSGHRHRYPGADRLPRSRSLLGHGATAAYSGRGSAIARFRPAT